jgi:nitroreductase
VPWDAWPHGVHVHPVLWAHRVDGLAPGAYLLPRSDEGAARLRRWLPEVTTWQPPLALHEARLPLRQLADHPALSGVLRSLSCQQAIAADACVAFSLLAEFDAPTADAPWRYRTLLQEAGLIGQVLYLQAEAEGYRGTGIGCYLDDAVHELLGLTGSALQVLYHFTVGVPLSDPRIGTEPAYANRAPVAVPPIVD